MKKKSDGYVLVYVLIVIVVLSLLALGVCSITLRNLQTQQASVEQMQEQYEVEGQMERFIAKLQVFQEDSSTYYYATSNEAKSAAHDHFWTNIGTMADGIVTIQESALTWEDDSCKLTVRAAAGEQVLTTEVKVSLDIQIKDHWVPGETEEDPGYTEYSYEIQGLTFTYDTYDMSTERAAEGEGGEAA